jgi:hypothetical protein
VVLVTHELLHVEGRRIVKTLASFAEEEGLGREILLLFGGKFGKDRGFRGFEDAVESAEDSERKDDLAIFGLFVIATLEIRDRPDERGQRLLGHEVTPGWATR